MPTFVVLEHDHPEPHWDFMLESGSVLKTWRLPEFPPQPGRAVIALALEDHRLLYLNNEGPISGDRGSVVRRDKGSFMLLEGDFENGPLLLALAGDTIHGAATLRRVEGTTWEFSITPFSRDAP